MIGRVGTAFGDAGINIASAAVGYTPEGAEADTAVMVVTTSAPVPQGVVEDLLAQDDFVVGRAVTLSS
jgi:D-3-phosphoglycerate dehydrogenase